MKLTREFYIPKGKDDLKRLTGHGYEIYTFSVDGKLRGMAFTGKRHRPDWHYQFSSPEDRDKRIADTIETMAIVLRDRQERRKKLTQPTDLKVGDILSGSWGYEQTNVDFYQVTKVIGKRTVEIREIACASSDSEWKGPMSDYVVPVKDNFIGEPMRKLVSNGYVNISSVVSVRKWEGKPMYRSWYH